MPGRRFLNYPRRLRLPYAEILHLPSADFNGAIGRRDKLLGEGGPPCAPSNAATAGVNRAGNDATSIARTRRPFVNAMSGIRRYTPTRPSIMGRGGELLNI